MKKALETYPVAPSIGLARMALDLAASRNTFGIRACGWDIGSAPIARIVLHPDGYSTTHEYYRIIDRLSRGEQP